MVVTGVSVGSGTNGDERARCSDHPGWRRATASRQCRRLDMVGDSSSYAELKMSLEDIFLELTTQDEAVDASDGEPQPDRRI